MSNDYVVTTANDGNFLLVDFPCIQDALSYWAQGNIMPNDKGVWVETFEVEATSIKLVDPWEGVKPIDDGVQPFDEDIPF